MRRTAALISCIALLLLLGSMFSLAGQETRVEGRSVYFSPHPAFSGDTMRISIDFSVTGGPANMTAVVEQIIPRPAGPPPATIVLGAFNRGDHVVDVYRYTVPASPPDRLCFNIKITGGEFRDVCLKRGRGGERSFMDIESPGRWTSTPAPATAASTEKPDLRIVGNLSVDETVRVENIGRASAAYIRLQRECFVAGRWVPSTEFENPTTLAPGQSVPFKVGRLASARGPCPAGSAAVRLVVDPRNLIAEMDENNNILEASALPDLRIVDFRIVEQTLGTTRSSLGQSVVVGFGLDFEISNTGTGDAVRFAWEVSVFRDGQWRSFIGERVQKLASGQHFKKEKVDVSRHVREGERVRLSIDALNEVPESHEDDNTRESVVKR
jgi:hypothetical protein